MGWAGYSDGLTSWGTSRSSSTRSQSSGPPAFPFRLLALFPAWPWSGVGSSAAPAPWWSGHHAHWQQCGRSVLPPPGTGRSHSALSRTCGFSSVPFPRAVAVRRERKDAQSPGSWVRGQPLRQWLLQRSRQGGRPANRAAELQTEGRLRTGRRGGELAHLRLPPGGLLEHGSPPGSVG